MVATQAARRYIRCMKWKPIVASLIVIALALGAMAILIRGDNEPEPPAPAEDPDDKPDDGDVTWERVELEPRDSLDPLALWPLDGMRMASPQFWVVWRTDREASACRLLARGRQGVWREMGHTNAFIHYMDIDLSAYDSEAWFCVEWSERGREYRSAERRVSFGVGAAFTKREYLIGVPATGEHRFPMRLQGGNPALLNSGSFLTTMLPDNLTCYVLPQADGAIEFVIQDGALVPVGGCFGFLQVHDAATDAYDRVLIRLRPV